MSGAFAIPEPFQFDASFSMKNVTVDAQHTGLFDGIAALNANRGDKATFDSLVQLVLAHFKCEEDAFVKYGLDKDEAAHHKQVHDKFVADVSAVSSIGDGEIAFLKKWLVNHIKGCDVKYMATLEGKDM